MLLLTSFIFAQAADLSAPALRLLNGEERRRANDFGQGDDKDCVLTSYTWAQDWAYYTGTISFSVPAADGFNYVVKVTDEATAAGKHIPGIYWTWWDGDATDVVELTDIAGDVWELDPRDAHWDGVTEISHYFNLGNGAAWDDQMPDPSLNEIELYFCSVPTTPAPTHSLQPTYGELMIDSSENLAETVTNIAGFLAQTSWESAKFTACDENNHKGYTNASCTQREDGALYQDVNSGEYACPLVANMNVTANTSASWAIGPLECTYGTETENCCWWGRGAIQTTGPTNYGTLQHEVLAKREGNTLDLCADPELICTEDDLKWTAGVYFWVTQVQQASCFVESLLAYTASFNADDTAAGTDCDSFAMGVGGVVNNGAWNTHAHGNYVDAAHQDVEDADAAVDGRVLRFKQYMTVVKTQLDLYEANNLNADNLTPTECTGNKAVDYILEEADLYTEAEINVSTVYSWSGFCTALKEFVA